MIGVQKVERENCFGTENRGRVPTDTHELSKGFKKSVFGTFAETNADGVVTRKVDHKYLPSICGSRAVVPGMSEVNNQTETLKSHAFEKAIRPDLGLKCLWRVRNANTNLGRT